MQVLAPRLSSKYRVAAAHLFACMNSYQKVNSQIDDLTTGKEEMKCLLSDSK